MRLIECKFRIAILFFIKTSVTIVATEAKSSPGTVKAIDLQQKFTNRCEELCATKELNFQEDLQPDCQRGCQYFNIQFLIGASDRTKLTDLKNTENDCKNSCGEAYGVGVKRQACHTGCIKMKDLQSTAPYVNGLLVYMGVSDKSLVILQSDYDIPSESDWILLDSVLRSNDEKFLEKYKMGENHFSEGSIPTGIIRKQQQQQQQQTPPPPQQMHLDLKNCFPTWKWMILLLMLGFLWMRYLTFLNITLTDVRGDNGTILIQNPYDCEKGALSSSDSIKIPDKRADEFLLSNDAYFYPTPVVPPPKYDEAIEAMLLQTHDGDGDDSVNLLLNASDSNIPKSVTSEENKIKI